MAGIARRRAEDADRERSTSGSRSRTRRPDRSPRRCDHLVGWAARHGYGARGHRTWRRRDGPVHGDRCRRRRRSPHDSGPFGRPRHGRLRWWARPPDPVRQPLRRLDAPSCEPEQRRGRIAGGHWGRSADLAVDVDLLRPHDAGPSGGRATGPMGFGHAVLHAGRDPRERTWRAVLRREPIHGGRNRAVRDRPPAGRQGMAGDGSKDPRRRAARGSVAVPGLARPTRTPSRPAPRT